MMIQHLCSLAIFLFRALCLGALFLQTGLPAAWCEEVELIADPHFTRGFQVQATRHPATVEGTLQWDKRAGPPVWTLALEGDLLPYLRAALQEAWKRGYLLQSQNLVDYQITSMNLGWEMPGLNDASVQIRNYHVVAHLQDDLRQKRIRGIRISRFGAPLGLPEA